MTQKSELRRKILTTYALPYANGPLHLGHMLGFIKTDIWVRWQRLQNNTCYFICGGDTHGTPIMLKAKERNQDPSEMVQEIMELQQEDLKDFNISLDHFYTTHSPENKKLSSEIYLKLKQHGDIKTKEIEQAYDDQAQMFLPDRFIKGTCPKCKAEDQYGDACEKCGSTYDPKEMINPKSQLSGQAPSYRKSVHYFFQLSLYEDILKTWMQEAKLQPSILNKLKEWFTQGLKDWDISRDAPYFGFEIPQAPGKYFYVWLDAPIGYLASFMNYCTVHAPKNSALPHEFENYFDPIHAEQNQTELYHFIGKDIAYFHTLFWPAVLHAAKYRLPTSVPVHGFVTINGEKMSKSRGTFITAKEFKEKINPEYLRYYYTSKLNDSTEDIDLNFEDFIAKCNSDLVGKLVNIAARSASFIAKYFNHQLGESLKIPELFYKISETKSEIAQAYETQQFSKVIRIVFSLADQVNQFVEAHQPWTLAKNQKTLPEVQTICTQAINHFYQLCVYLKPILPDLIQKSELFLNIKNGLTLEHLNKPLLNHTLNPFQPLLMRIDPEKIKDLINNKEK